MHPNAFGGDYTLTEYEAFCREQFAGGTTTDLPEAHHLAMKMWSESESALSCWSPMSPLRFLDLRQRGTVVLCTSPREMVAGLKPLLRADRIAVSAGYPGDATSGLGAIGDWHSRWASKTVGVASTRVLDDGTDTLTLAFIAGAPTTGSQREWASRRDLGDRIAFETGGQLKTVLTVVLDGDELAQHYNTTRAELARIYFDE